MITDFRLRIWYAIKLKEHSDHQSLSKRKWDYQLAELKPTCKRKSKFKYTLHVVMDVSRIFMRNENWVQSLHCSLYQLLTEETIPDGIIRVCHVHKIMHVWYSLDHELDDVTMVLVTIFDEHHGENKMK